MPVVPATQEAKAGATPEEFEAAVSHDCTTALQTGQQSKNLFRKNKTKQKNIFKQHKQKPLPVILLFYS